MLEIDATNNVPNKLLFFLITGRKPNVNNMHPFGSFCNSYVHHKSRLDLRCNPGVFVGYDKESHAYLVYYPVSVPIS